MEIFVCLGAIYFWLKALNLEAEVKYLEEGEFVKKASDIL